MEPPQAALSDKELMDRLKHEAAQWFNNPSILLLEELFRRYNRCLQQMKSQPSLGAQ